LGYRISWRKQRQKKQQKLQNENHGRSVLKLSKNRRSVIECDASIRKGLERADLTIFYTMTQSKHVVMPMLIPPVN
nr:hypothetical protein [Tanacetum cinerariifolium]